MAAAAPISIIIPTYNRAGGFLEQAIDSALAQVDAEFEILVVDDGSTDATSEVISSYGSKIRSFYQQNKGPAAARNFGIKEAKNELLAFLDSDDWWDRKKLSVQARIMAENPQFLISHTDEVWFRRGVFLNQKKIHTRPHGHIFEHCLPLCCVGMSTVMARRSFFDQVGLFDESFPCCEDYELWLRASMSFPFLKINEALTFKQGGREDQVSSLFRVGMDRFRIRAMEKVAGLADCNDQQRLAIAREIIRKATIYAQGCLKHGKADEAALYQKKVEKWQHMVAD